jgi:hypothetical protein
MALTFLLCAALGRTASLRDHRRPLSAISLQYNSTPKQNGTLDLSEEFGDITPGNLHKAALYVLGEKTQMKVLLAQIFFFFLNFSLT